MAPSRNSTDVTNPPTRARTWTSSTASNRPVNSSQSVTVRLTGCATVTEGGAAAACDGALSAAGQGDGEQNDQGRGHRMNGVEILRSSKTPDDGRTQIHLLLHFCRDRSRAADAIVRSRVKMRPPASLCKNRDGASKIIMHSGGIRRETAWRARAILKVTADFAAIGANRPPASMPWELCPQVKIAAKSNGHR
jgi:hypothetical protein